MKQVESYFKSYPNNECFTTSDGMVFHKKGDANLHAASLDDKEVTEHKRAKYALPGKSNKSKNEGNGEPEGKGKPKGKGKETEAGATAGTGTAETDQQ